MTSEDLEECPKEEMVDPDELKFRAMLLDPSNNEPQCKNEPWAMWVEWEAGELTDVRDGGATSNSEKARPLYDTGQCLHLTEAQVRWLHEQLGKLIALQDKAP